MARQSRSSVNKIYKEGLFLFECDGMSDICKTNKIQESSDHIKEGNTVTLDYDGEFLRAKIVMLSGNISMLQTLFFKLRKFM